MRRLALAALILACATSGAAAQTPGQGRWASLRQWLPRQPASWPQWLLRLPRLRERLGVRQIRSVDPVLQESGIKTEKLLVHADPGDWGRQRQSQWCWAATSQIVLNYLGVPISQEAVVQRAFGGLVNATASPETIAASVDGWRIDHEAGVAVVRARAYDTLDPAVAVSDLENGRPFVVGLKGGVPNAPGHAYVVTSVTYKQGPSGQPVPVSVRLRDPWPTNPSSLEIPIAELQRRWIGAVRFELVR